MLAKNGNTAVYLQYAVARSRSVQRRAGGAPATAPLLLDATAERALALKLSQFPAAVVSAADHLEPHRLCGYLYDLAVAFSTFFQHCPILRADSEELRASRLALCAHTEQVLAAGLDLLGITAPDRL